MADLSLLGEIANLTPAALLVLFIFLGATRRIVWGHELADAKQRYQATIDVKDAAFTAMVMAKDAAFTAMVTAKDAQCAEVTAILREDLEKTANRCTQYEQMALEGVRTARSAARLTKQAMENNTNSWNDGAG